MDWNWLYSSLSQSIAAIVGIFSAFIITKILNNQQEFSRKKRRLQELQNNSMKLKDMASQRQFNWYNERMREHCLKNIKTLLEEHETILTPEEYYQAQEFSPFDSKQDITEHINRLISNHQAKKREEELKNQRKGINIVPNYRATLWEPNILPITVPPERERINSLITEIKHNLRALSDFSKDISENPESSSLITFSIYCSLALFYIGVIYPLSLLPISTSQNAQTAFQSTFSKLFILSSVSIIFTAIMVVFLVINVRLKYDKNDKESISLYLKPGTYSKFFENYFN